MKPVLFRKTKLFSLSLLAVGLAVVCGCREEAPVAPPPRPEVVVIEVQPRTVPVTFEYVGQTQSSHEVQIRSRVTGFLDKRTYTEGAIVKKGQVLFLMDDKPFQAQLDAILGALAQHQAQLQTARATLARIRPLAAQDAASQKDLDDAVGREQASAAAVQTARAQVVQAQLNLSYCTIMSPVTGISAEAMQQDGAYIDPLNSQLTTVSVLSPMRVNFSVSENEFRRYRTQVAKGRLRPPEGNDYIIEVVLVDGSVFPFTGRITFAAPSYDVQTGTFLIRTSVDNPEGVLRPNQYVRVRMKGAERPNAILVPQRAVQQGAKGHFLWVVTKEGKAESRPVVIGDWSGDSIFIEEGLRAGDRVVVDGGLSLSPGMPVTVKPLADTQKPADAEKAANAGTTENGE
ncbi:MAG: efflux RND transporter periplasmic adaptor subunit [Syntrophotaleaceae bacterium]